MSTNPFPYLPHVSPTHPGRWRYAVRRVQAQTDSLFARVIALIPDAPDTPFLHKQLFATLTIKDMVLFVSLLGMGMNQYFNVQARVALNEEHIKVMEARQTDYTNSLQELTHSIDKSMVPRTEQDSTNIERDKRLTNIETSLASINDYLRNHPLR